MTNKRALIIEDEDLISSFLTKILEAQGFEVKVAINGFVASNLLEVFNPTLITLDLMMPSMNGFEILDYIKCDANYDGVKVIVVSAADDENIQAAIKSGADDYICKPIDSKVFLEKINKLLKS